MNHWLVSTLQTSVTFKWDYMGGYVYYFRHFMQQFYLSHSVKQLNKPFEMVLLWQALLSHIADILTLLLQAEVILIT